jgi:hypothetical protein
MTEEVVSTRAVRRFAVLGVVRLTNRASAGHLANSVVVAPLGGRC